MVQCVQYELSFPQWFLLVCLCFFWKTSNALQAGGIRLIVYFVFSLNFKLNTTRYVPKAFLSPFVAGMTIA